jgi:UDP-N-acetylglucosamine 4,6-dehydratase/5-epimerase
MKSILITGGTGSFGRAFTKRLLDDNSCERICIYSRGEHAQADMRAALYDDPRCRWFIGDVRDQARLKRAMRGVDVVVHAAALKRIEVGATNPIEMIKTNVDGAVNVIEASQDAGIKKVVALSSDKAYAPASPYGASKALAESLFLAANNTVGHEGPKYSVVRYGNVWCSAGSLVPTWRKMIERGALRVPVTDPDCTRFFMRLSEAVDLVMDTITTMPGKVVIPRLPAYRVGDVAFAMGADIDVKGLPEWAKLHEGMDAGNTSDRARRMTIAELRAALADIGFVPLMEVAE